MNKIKYIYILVCIIFIYILYRYNTTYEPYTNLEIGYVINLDERSDRLKKISDMFLQENLYLKRIPAIKDTIGIRGCGYSHMNAIQMAKDEGLPSILILEDDCLPTKYFKYWFPIKEWLDNNMDKWDIFNGGNVNYGMHPNEQDKIQPVCSINNTIKLYKSLTLAFHFYYVNSKVYDTMLEWKTVSDNDKSLVLGVDQWPDMKGLITISSVPFLAIQEDGYSDNDGIKRSWSNTFERAEEILNLVENNIPCE
jgi:hypothetical protein